MGRNKGGIPWNKGTKGICKANSGSCQKGENHWIGRKHTEESKQKISVAKKQQANSEFFKKIGLKGILAQQLSKNPTSLEQVIYNYLVGQGIIFEKQYLVNGRFLVDVYIPSTNTIIEVDGKYWHSLERVVKKDKAENAYLKKCGYKLMRISEEEIKNKSYVERMVI